MNLNYLILLQGGRRWATYSIGMAPKGMSQLLHPVANLELVVFIFPCPSTAMPNEARCTSTDPSTCELCTIGHVPTEMAASSLPGLGLRHFLLAMVFHAVHSPSHRFLTLLDLEQRGK